MNEGEETMNSGALYPLTLSFLAGLSTAIGGCIAVVKKPDEGLLALLLGLALGVMSVLSVWELLLQTAIRQGVVVVSTAFAIGGLAFYLLRMFIPEHHSIVKDEEVPCEPLEMLETGESELRRAHSGGVATHQRVLTTSSEIEVVPRNVSREDQEHSVKSSVGSGTRLPPHELMRLGMLMALTMTLHNMPEGFAVAFTAMTDIGVLMTTTIALHNIPEGIVVAGPIYAATGSRWKAAGLALASGMSEPVGACLALIFIGPYLTTRRLDVMLSFVGGIMLSVCAFELWPEARKCRNNWRMAQGIGLGSFVMVATLFNQN